jgi:hypothetical protein
MDMRVVDTMDARYVRAGGQSGTRIRYRRIGTGGGGKRLNAKAGRQIARLAYMICVLAPDEADSILELSSWRVGRLIKSILRRTQKTLRKRRAFSRRSTSCVLRG